MPVFTVHHTTTYRYRQPVGFGEHQLMLRPAESRDQRLLAADLTITPEPASLHWWTDALGNRVGTARFSGRAKSLCFQSTIRVDHTLRDPGEPPPGEGAPPPPGPGDIGEGGSQLFLRRRHADPDAAVAQWARSFQAGADPSDPLTTLAAMTQAIQGGFTYVRREKRGIQGPARTLATRAGSCRDFSVLMIEAARSLSIPARFVSGYLHLAGRVGGAYHGGGSTHAWAQAWLPEIGWTDFDPTNGIVGNRDLIRVAMAPDPGQVVPLSGTFIGFPADQIGMEVSVRVTAQAVRERDERRCGLVV